MVEAGIRRITLRHEAKALFLRRPWPFDVFLSYQLLQHSFLFVDLFESLLVTHVFPRTSPRKVVLIKLKGLLRRRKARGGTIWLEIRHAFLVIRVRDVDLLLWVVRYALGLQVGGRGVARGGTDWSRVWGFAHSDALDHLVLVVLGSWKVLVLLEVPDDVDKVCFGLHLL
jgi:hypothetical protein